MLRFLVFIIVVALLPLTYKVLEMIDCNQKPPTEELFNGNSINVDKAVFFSNTILAESIKNYLTERECVCLNFLSYPESKISFTQEDTIETMKNKLERFQILKQQMEGSVCYAQPVLNFWCQNAYKKYYRSELKKYLIRKYEEGEISTHSYNEIAKKL